MLSTPTPSKGAMAAANQTTAPATTSATSATSTTSVPNISADTRRAAKAVARVMHTATPELKSVYGATLRGVVPHIFADDGTTPINSSVRVTFDADGRAVGFTIGNGAAIDYRSPQNGPALWHASNVNLARRMKTKPIEEQLARAIASIISTEMLEALHAIGVTTDKLSMLAAHRIAHGIVSECIANATTAQQQGSLNALRAFPPTIRFALIRPLLADPKADMIRDLLLAAPILSLAPRLLNARAGHRPKEILAALGLPVEARKLLPRALSPYRRFMLHDGRDLATGDCPWLTPALLTALPDHSLHQYRVIFLGFELHLRKVPHKAIAERLTWVARNAAEIYDQPMPGLVRWFFAEPAMLARYNIRPWNPEITVAAARAAIEDLGDLHERLGAPESTEPFIIPKWAETQAKLPNSKWSLRIIRDEAELIEASRRMANCAAIYAGPCRQGDVTIVEIIRPITPGSKLPHDGTFETGAMAEITNAFGQHQVAQCVGRHNGAPRATAAAALNRFIDALNGTTAPEEI